MADRTSISVCAHSDPCLTSIRVKTISDAPEYTYLEVLLGPEQLAWVIKELGDNLNRSMAAIRRRAREEERARLEA